jgi:excisionase family DNA binding protein
MSEIISGRSFEEDVEFCFRSFKTLVGVRERFERIVALAECARAMQIDDPDNLSTFNVEEMLNVSRPYVMELLDSGELPSQKVGSVRRVKLKDLLEYRDKQDKRRDETMDELVALTETLGLYDS